VEPHAARDGIVELARIESLVETRDTHRLIEVCAESTQGGLESLPLLEMLLTARVLTRRNVENRIPGTQAPVDGVGQVLGSAESLFDRATKSRKRCPEVEARQRFLIPIDPSVMESEQSEVDPVAIRLEARANASKLGTGPTRVAATRKFHERSPLRQLKGVQLARCAHELARNLGQQTRRLVVISSVESSLDAVE
jgi:hypothetical protein